MHDLETWRNSHAAFGFQAPYFACSPPVLRAIIGGNGGQDA